MNKLYLKSIFAAWLMLCVGVSAWAATTYCGTTITSVNQKHSAAITCSSLGENRYLFEFVSEDEFTGYNAGSNFFMKVNGMSLDFFTDFSISSTPSSWWKFMGGRLYGL